MIRSPHCSRITIEPTKFCTPRIGRDWYLKDFNNAPEAVKYGDECWSRVLLNWENWRTQSLTLHRNWWPELYRAA